MDSGSANVLVEEEWSAIYNKVVHDSSVLVTIGPFRTDHRKSEVGQYRNLICLARFVGPSRKIVSLEGSSSSKLKRSL